VARGGLARTLLVLPPHLIEGALGVFFLLMISARRWLSAHRLRLRLPHLVGIGAVVGFLIGIVVTTGPITAPIFLSYFPPLMGSGLAFRHFRRAATQLPV
jgi:hypothetical protein